MMTKFAVAAASLPWLASALPEYASSNGGGAPPCPHVGVSRRGLADEDETADPLATANARRDARVEEWGYPLGPAMNGPHKYKVGEANEGEMYCEADGATRWCDTIHGAWGDSVPRTAEHCIWAVLEFQDPPEFGWGVDEANTTAMNNMFAGAGRSLATSGFGDKFLIYEGTGGSPTGKVYDLPWAAAMIVWTHGNEAAKPWIADFHRPVEQTVGYGWGWVLRAHYKAFNCAEFGPALEANNVREGVDSPDRFARLWNAYMDVTDLSGDFFEEETCSIGPCQDAYADGNVDGNADGNTDGNIDTDTGTSTDETAGADGDHSSGTNLFIAANVIASGLLFMAIV